MKKIITAAAFTVAVLALAACGSGKANDLSAASAESTAAAAITTTSARSTAISPPIDTTQSSKLKPQATVTAPASTGIKEFAAATVPDLTELRTTQLEPKCTDDCAARLLMATGYLIGFENHMKTFGFTEATFPPKVGAAYASWRDDIMKIDLATCDTYLTKAATAPLCSMNVLTISWATNTLELRLQTASLN